MQTIPIQGSATTAGGGGCQRSAGQAPVCRATLGHACEAPRLSGPPAEVQRLLAALEPVLGAVDTSGLLPDTDIDVMPAR